MIARATLLLCAWLIGATASAQPASTPPAFVDSRDECTAFGGSWLTGRGNWQAACQLPWTRAECLRQRAAWTPISLAPEGGTCMAQVSQQAVARQCTTGGGIWGPTGSAMPYCQPAPATAASTLRRASDANKACVGQNDCIYGCLYTGPPVAIGAQVKGQCRATNQIAGCYEMVEQGRLAGNICKR